MQLTRFDSIAPFWMQAEPYLCQREAEHNLMLGVGGAIRDGSVSVSNPYLALATEGGALVMVSLRTPPRELLISCDAPPPAIDLLADDLLTVDPALNGVTAARDVSLRFAQAWESRTGCAYRRHMAMRIFRLDQVFPPQPAASGMMRAARTDERDLLTDWAVAFSAEALDVLTRDNAERMIERLLTGNPEQRGLRVWEDGGRAVSMAAYGGPTPHGIRVNLVYTPPELRGRGYASACVAALSQELLKSGRQFCFLFTDLANPTSNHIYQMIGYRPVSDVDMYRFEGGG